MEWPRFLLGPFRSQNHDLHSGEGVVMGAITDPPGHPGYGLPIESITRAKEQAMTYDAELRQRVRSLLAEREAMRKDAERYKWIRRSGGEQPALVSQCWGNELDERIDAAIDASLAGAGDKA